MRCYTIGRNREVSEGIRGGINREVISLLPTCYPCGNILASKELSESEGAWGGQGPGTILFRASIEMQDGEPKCLIPERAKERTGAIVTINMTEGGHRLKYKYSDRVTCLAEQEIDMLGVYSSETAVVMKTGGAVIVEFYPEGSDQSVPCGTVVICLNRAGEFEFKKS